MHPTSNLVQEVSDMTEAQHHSRRGRPPRAEPAEATGYRVTSALRRELDIARGFTGAKSTQAVIDAAVRAYLIHLRDTMPNFRVAAEALDAELGKGVVNVSQLHRSRRGSA
jgi:hypothetical protein